MRLALPPFLALVMATACGCQNIQWPQFFSWGSVRNQRLYAANVIDPYAVPEAGPNIEDTRPRDFNRPYSETRRVQSSPYANQARQPRVQFPWKVPPAPSEELPASTPVWSQPPEPSTVAP
jgi:hypothetical protein